MKKTKDSQLLLPGTEAPAAEELKSWALVELFGHNGTVALICFPFEKIQQNIMAQIDRASARGQVIAEILGIWDDTLKIHPELKKEHRIAVEWLTKTFTGSEMGV